MEGDKRKRGSVPLKDSGSQIHGKKSLGNRSTSACKTKQSHGKLKSRTYPLRSSQNCVRVLRSTSTTINKTLPLASPVQPVNISGRKKGRKKRTKKQVKDIYSKISIHVRYLLQRMAYEQNLIDAYASEGWKGQSSEKIRPEMELERAKSEILKCKLRIRGQFQQLDSLVSEGKFEDSLFDSEGQIDSEDILCSKCGSKELSKNNDIILCDGICDRGFHQKCLTPPLLNEDIPPGDMGWLCPGCDCKVVCVDTINELHGLHLSVEDSWEKVFPEAAALAAGDNKFDDLGLPSDDSEDDNYDPGNPEVAEKYDEGSNLEEGSEEDSSEESFSSEEPVTLASDLPGKNLEFPSDDSEDDDFDPDEPNQIVKTPTDGSSSNASDFTSDTDDLHDFCGSKESLTFPNETYACVESTEGASTGDKNKAAEQSGLCSPDMQEPNKEKDVITPKRKLERLDYQKLYEETYGNTSSDESDDEDWSQKSTKKAKNDSARLSKDNSTRNINGSHINMKNRDTIKGSPEFSSENTSGHGRGKKHRRSISSRTNSSGGTSRRSIQDNNLADLESKDGKSPASGSRFLGKLVSQKLQESFNENQYPSRLRKESLANELGITSKQVDKWFGNARHSLHVSAKKDCQVGKSAGKETIATVSTPISSDVKPTNETPNGKIEVADDKSTPINSTKETPNSKTETAHDKCTPISMSITPDLSVGGPQINLEDDKQTPGNTENNITPSSIIAKNAEERTGSLIEEIDRRSLVLRELRKRRRSK